VAEELVALWWNGTGGRLTRRDVWLAREVRWHVVAIAGDSETGDALRWEFDTEDEARQMCGASSKPTAASGVSSPATRPRSLRTDCHCPQG
jgi:hypothetical protein